MLQQNKNKKTLRNAIIFIAIAIVCFIVSNTDLLGQSTYVSYTMCSMGMYCIIGTGLDVMFGQSGQISFGHSGFYAIGAYTASYFAKMLGLNPWIGFFLSMVVTGFIGFLFAFPASRLQKHFLSFMTIAFAQMIYNLVMVLDPITGGAIGTREIPALPFFGVDMTDTRNYFVLVFICTALILLVKQCIVKSRTGRAFRAVAGNSVAANGMGIDVKKYKIMAVTVSAAMTGLAGALYCFQMRVVSPEAFDQSISTIFMTVVLFGGLATFSGPIIGAVALQLIQIWLQEFSSFQKLIYAAFIILILYLMPQGINGIIRNLKHKWNEKKLAKKVNENAEA